MSMRVEHVQFGLPRQSSRVRGCLRSLGLPALIAGMAASAVTFASVSGGAPALSSDPGSPGGRLIASVFEAIHSRTEHRASTGSRIPDGSQSQKVRLASLEPDFRPMDRTAFDQRFNSSSDERFSSFDERFAATPESDVPRTLRAPELGRDSLAPPEAPKRHNGRAAMLAPAAGAPAVTRSVTAALSQPARPTDTRSEPAPAEPGPRTAIYDITAKVVYLPNGKKLEAHSGLGQHMDDPRSVALKSRGVTPPNIYNLSMRERPFHGVRAIRLTPVEPDKMFGRDGILAHSYLLGPSGESNGCVSIGDYPKFLAAFENGEIDRIMVVERLEAPPDSKTGIGWLPEKLKALFRWS
jgi:hypothetical protein